MTEKIEIRELEGILKDREVKEPIVLLSDGKEVAALISLDDLALLNEVNAELEMTLPNIDVKIMTDQNLHLDYEVYEKLRDQLLKSFEAVFAPKVEKMN